jgi:hypothetical protein
MRWWGWVGLLLIAARADANQWWADPGCTNDGDGTAQTCAATVGGVGAAKTLVGAVAAMRAATRSPGDEVIGRGVHGTHGSGATLCTGLTNWNAGPEAVAAYHEILWNNSSVGRPAGNPGLPLDCTGNPCTIRAARATDTCSPACGDETLFLMPNQLQAWTPFSGSGASAVYVRTMELATDWNAPNPDLPSSGSGPLRCNGASPSCSPITQTGDANYDPYVLFTTNPKSCTNDPARNCTVNADCVSSSPCIYSENRTNLPYMGDNNQTPADGYWSFRCTCTGGTNAGTVCTSGDTDTVCTGGGVCTSCEVYVNPPMADNPDTTLLVPFAYSAWDYENPTQYVTLQDVDVGMSRSHGIKGGNSGSSSQRKPGMVRRRVQYRHIRRMADLTHWNTGIVWDNCIWDGGARGFSWMTLSANSYYGVRAFHDGGGHLINPIFRNLGAAGQHRANGTNYASSDGGAGEQFSFGDGPWRAQSFTDKSCPSFGAQTKQGHGDGTDGSNTGFWVEGGDFGPILSTGVFVDASTEVMVEGTATYPLTFHEVSTCIAGSNFTPDAATGDIYWSNATFRNFTCRNSGWGNTQKASLSFCGTDASQRNTGQTTNPLFRLYNALIVNPCYAAWLVAGNGTAPSYTCPNQTSDPGNIYVANVTVTGTNPATECGGISRGPVIRNVSATGGYTERNVIVNNVTREARVVDPMALAHMIIAGTTIDYSYLGATGACPPGCTCTDGSNMALRYGTGLTIPTQSQTTQQPAGGTCASLATWQSDNPTQDTHTPAAGQTMNFVSSSDPHLTAANNAGETQTVFLNDGDLQARTVPWDAGADEFISGATTTATTTTSTTTTTLSPGACGGSSIALCNGTCPTGQICVSVAHQTTSGVMGTCECMSSCGGTYPTCSGGCMPPEVCGPVDWTEGEIGQFCICGGQRECGRGGGCGNIRCPFGLVCRSTNGVCACGAP